MDDLQDFQKFKCVITNSMEDYDSGVWEFFRHFEMILADLGQLMILDNEWRETYVILIRYLSDLGSSIIQKKNAPDSGFLNPLVSKEIESTDTEDVILRAKQVTASYLIRVGNELESLMAEGVRLGRIQRFSMAFTKDKFEGLRLLTRVVYSRSIFKSKE